MTVALLSLVGIPPLVGFTAKLELFAATLEAGYGWLAVINTVISAFYYLRVIPPMYLEPPEGEVALLGPPSAVAIAALALVATGLGVELLFHGLDLESSQSDQTQGSSLVEAGAWLPRR
ncbi:MAG: proton-conducting transporter membrane subunit [Sandaracinaceae bacterium]